MHFTTFALMCCLAIGFVVAYPYPDPDQQQDRWQLQGGYNSDKTGKDISVAGRAPVWTSNNGRHEVDATGHYGQHFGGPWGKSPPSWGAGGVYRYRF